MIVDVLFQILVLRCMIAKRQSLCYADVEVISTEHLLGFVRQLSEAHTLFNPLVSLTEASSN